MPVMVFPFASITMLDCEKENLCSLVLVMATTTFQNLQPSPLRETGHLVRIKDNDILLVPASLHTDDHIYKYCKRTNSWIEMMNLKKYCDSSTGLFVEEARFDPSSNELYITLSKGNVMTINIDAEECSAQSAFWTVGEVGGYQANWTMWHCVLIGDHFHAVTRHYIVFHRLYYIVVHKLTGETVQEPLDIGKYLDWADQIVYLESRNSLVLFGHDIYDKPAHCEYSLTTKEWTICDWGPSTYFSLTAVVAPANTQYIVAFGGINHYKSSPLESDVIRIYDFKLKQCIEIEGACPVIDIDEAELIRDRDRTELITFGFVNRCFKAPKFRNMAVLPRYLIQLIANWVADEYVHLLSRSKGHYKANMDYIMEDIFDQVDNKTKTPSELEQKTRKRGTRGIEMNERPRKKPKLN